MKARASDKNRSVFGFASGFGAPEVMRKAHQHQELEINLLRSGRLTYLMAGDVVSLDPGRLAVFWAAAPHQVITVAARTRFYWLTVPIAWVLQWNLPAWFVRELLHGRLFVDPPDAKDELRSACWHADLATGRAERQKAAQLEIEARLRRLIDSRTAPDSAPPSRATRHATADGHVQRMAAIIAERYTDRLTVEEIVAPTGLHPNYAMNLFKKTCGLSLVDYLVQMRIFHARRLLTTTDAKIIDVAHASGFGSESRFYEAFLAACQCSPGEYRARFR